MQKYFLLKDGNWMSAKQTETIIRMFLWTIGLSFLVCDDEDGERYLILSTRGFADSPRHSEMCIQTFLAHDDWLTICAGHIDANGAQSEPGNTYNFLHGKEQEALLNDINELFYIQPQKEMA